MIYFCVRKQQRIDEGKFKKYCRKIKCDKFRYFANEGAFKKRHLKK
jgi:hypothetical protein